MEYLLSIDDQGRMIGIWSDGLIELYEVEQGGVEVERASQVEFSSTTQRWHVWNADGQALMESMVAGDKQNVDGWMSRSEALAWEVEEINRRIEAGSVW